MKANIKRVKPQPLLFLSEVFDSANVASTPLLPKVEVKDIVL